MSPVSMLGVGGQKEVEGQPEADEEGGRGGEEDDGAVEDGEEDMEVGGQEGQVTQPQEEKEPGDKEAPAGQVMVEHLHLGGGLANVFTDVCQWICAVYHITFCATSNFPPTPF